MSATLGLQHQSAWTPEFGRAVKRARRHSRLVRTLRVGIPFVIAATIGLYAVALWLNPLSGISGLSMAKLAISGTRVTMNMPRLTGFSSDGRSYELTASAAAQDLKQPQMVELKDVRATMQLRGGGTVRVTADNGLYDTKSEAIDLRDNVLVATSDGTEVRLQTAAIDMRKGHVTSDRPVDVTMQRARILGNRLEVNDGGAVVHFRGGVTMYLQPDAKSAGVHELPAPQPTQTRAEATE
jgi:lipopolysaccharide export system protein LptC